MHVFDRMEKEEARIALNQAVKVLRHFEKKVDIFRAPELQFPKNILSFWKRKVFCMIPHLQPYKPPFPRSRVEAKNNQDSCYNYLFFFKVSPALFLPLLKHAKAPLIFVHPWNLWTCPNYPYAWLAKFNTGKKALQNLKTLIYSFKAEKLSFFNCGKKEHGLEKLWAMRLRYNKKPTLIK